MDQQNALGATNGTLISPKINSTQPIEVWLGGAGNTYSAQELAQGLDLTKLIHIQHGNNTVQFPIQITFGSNDQLQVSAKVLDANNNTIAEIINNEWKSPSPSSMQIWDRNYNSNAFEVIDSNGIPILQVEIGQQNKILIGISLYAQGVPLFTYITTGINYFSNGPKVSDLQAIRNAAIFRYPSTQYLGVMNGSSNNHNNNPLAFSTWEIRGGIILAIIGLTITTFISVETVRTKNKSQ